MINLAQEKSYKLSAKDRYDILSFAIEAADDGGFVSSFVFERAMYLYAALVLEEDYADAIRSHLITNLVEAWDFIIQEDILQEMITNYQEDLDQLAEEGWTWFEEYTSYITSARGVLSFAQQFSGDIVSSAVEALSTTMEDSGAKDLLKVADEWGMTRGILKDKK